MPDRDAPGLRIAILLLILLWLTMAGLRHYHTEKRLRGIAAECNRVNQIVIVDDWWRDEDVPCPEPSAPIMCALLPGFDRFLDECNRIQRIVSR
jgi:hypothetical protein